MTLLKQRFTLNSPNDLINEFLDYYISKPSYQLKEIFQLK